MIINTVLRVEEKFAANDAAKGTIKGLPRCQPASRAFLSLHFGVLVHGSRKVFVEHVLIVTGVQFPTKTNSCALSTAGSVMTSADLSKSGCSQSKKPV